MMLQLLKKKQAVEHEEPPLEESELPEREVVGWAGGAQLRTTLVRGLLWCAVLCGVASFGLLLVLMASSGADEPAAAPASAEPAGRIAAQDVAQEAVVLMLTATQDDKELKGRLEAILPGTFTLPKKAPAVTNVAVAEATYERGAWAVTVAADVDHIRRYYHVAVASQGGKLSVLTLPAQIPAPSVELTDRHDYATQVSVSSPVGVAVGDFMAALLAGIGDVARYSTPGKELHAVTPPPCVSVQVGSVYSYTEIPEEIADGVSTEVIARITCTDAAERKTSYDYVLALTMRASRWEVSAIHTTPRREEPSPAPTPDLSASPSAAPTENQ